jgi:TPR repeat protein
MAAWSEDALLTGAQAGDAQALQTLRDRASQGNAQAQLHMGELLATGGTGVPQDPDQARMWLLVATEGLKADQAKAAGEAAQIGQQMSPEARAEGDRLAREWKPQSTIAQPDPLSAAPTSPPLGPPIFLTPEAPAAPTEAK